MSRAYWIKGRAKGIHQSIIAKIGAVLDIDEMAKLISPERSLAVKINLSEIGYSHYLHPIVASTFFEKLREAGAQPVITDSCSLFKGSRHTGYDWVHTALIQGFSTGETFDSQMMLAGGYTGEEGKFYVAEGRNLGGVELGSLLTDTGALMVLSHVTAHPLMGFAGATYNLGAGLLTGTGKLRIHSVLEIVYHRERCDNCALCVPYCPTGAVSMDGDALVFDSEMCNKCLGCFFSCPNSAMTVRPEGIVPFQESVVEAAHTALANLRGPAFFVNFLTSVTPQSDDYPFSDIPFIPDLGIVASDDPVAADWVTYQMITRSPGISGSVAEALNVLGKGEDKITAITGVTPELWLEYAQQLGLGSVECDFVAAQ
ncbi:MAG: DUF362 domain-containing protein [Thermodesulfobacteriota bacterium]